jgi:hypothetical protein
MLPFLEREEINKLIDEVLEEKVDLKLVYVLPYADEEKIDAVIDRALTDDSILVDTKHLLPFLNQRQMEKLYEAYQEGIIKRGEVCGDDILPFLNKDKIKEIFEAQLKKMKLIIKEDIESAIKDLKNNN